MQTKTIDEAAKEYLDNMLQTFGNPQYIDSRKVLRDFKAGANWQKEAPISQPVKEAKSAEEILDQFDGSKEYPQLIMRWEAEQAMEAYHAQFTNSNMVEVEKVADIIAHFKYNGSGLNPNIIHLIMHEIRTTLSPPKSEPLNSKENENFNYRKTSTTI